MTTEAIEILEPKKVAAALNEVDKTAKIEKDDAIALRNNFKGFYNDIVACRGDAVDVTDPEDPDHRKQAKIVRIKLKNIRCKVENARKLMKSESLARGKAIDGYANVLKYLCEPVEAKLDNIEKHEEKMEAQRIADVIAVRSATLVSIHADPSVFNLGQMDEETFDKVLEISKRQEKERIELKLKAEADRIESERVEKEKQERVKKENENLRKEKEVADAELEKEREKVRKEKAKLESELKKERDAKAKKDKAEEKRKADVAAEKSKAEQAPDGDKLIALSEAIEYVELPNMETDKGHKLLTESRDAIKQVVAFIAERGYALKNGDK